MRQKEEKEKGEKERQKAGKHLFTVSLATMFTPARDG